MKTPKSIAIIGSGNIANFLALQFFSKQFTIAQVISRNAITGNDLALKVNAEFSESYDLHESIDIILICVPDNQIEFCIANLKQTGALVCHCAGSIGVGILQRFNRYGVLYPLQSISGNMDLIPEVPFLIEASSADNLKELKYILDLLEYGYREVGSDDRLHYHLAAVFANNFTNAMLLATSEILEKGHLDFSLLKPLIVQTFEKLIMSTPHESQTGPAKRNDLITIQKHIELLKNDAELSEIYRSVSQYITRKFKY